MRHFFRKILVVAAVLMMAALSYAKGGPDSFGYTYVDSTESGGPKYEWIDLSVVGSANEGEQYKLATNQMGPAVSLGFTFSFYGVKYTRAYISSKGFLTFTEGQDVGCCAGDPMPNPNSRLRPHNLVAGFWADLNPGG